MVKYIVSACLAGLKTRYDGTDALCARVRELVEKGEAVPFCPEQAGGLPTPRTPAEITGGDGYVVLSSQVSNACHTSQTHCIDQPNQASSEKTCIPSESKPSVVDTASNKDNQAYRTDQTDCANQPNQAQHTENTCCARVVTKDGVDVTANYMQGAKEMLKLACTVGATKAVMKAKSPSCGVGSIYDGTFSGNITRGDGVAAALLKLSGIDVMTEDDFVNALKDD
jgi:uncharacterized protein YbbK (DUF523 family)